MAEVFISYSRTDTDFVRKLDNALSKANRQAWVDWQDIPPTAQWLAEIQAGIEAADNFVFILSPESIASETCQKEVAHAATNNKRIVPILHRVVPDSQVPNVLRQLNWLFFRDSDDFRERFDTLITALDTDLDSKRVHSRLLVRAKEWEQQGHESSFLLRGRDLREAEEWQAQTASREPKATALHSQYILSSRRAESRRRQQQMAAIIVALLVSVGLAIVAMVQRNTARRQAAIATSRQLAAQSGTLVASKPDLALLLALEAERTDDSFETRSALFTAMEHRPRLKAFLRSVGNRPSGIHARRLDGLAFAPDGSLIAGVGGLDNNTVVLWDARTLQRVATLEGHTAPVLSVAFTPDSKTLLTGGHDKVLIFWDVQRREPVAKLTDHPGTITSIAINADGTMAASGDDGNNVLLWDLNRRAMIAAINSPSTRYISHVEWRGDQLVTVGLRAGKPANDEITEFWDTNTRTPISAPLDYRLLTFSRDLARFSSVSKYEGPLPFIGTKVFLSEAQRDADHPASEDEQQKQITVNVNLSASGTSLAGVPMSGGPVTSATFSLDGSMLAVGNNTDVELLDLNNQRILELPQAHQDIIDTVAFAPDGTTLVSSGWDDAVIAWHVAGQGALGRELAQGGGGPLAFSPDGKMLAAAIEGKDGEETVVLWEVATGKPIRSFQAKLSQASVLENAPGSLMFDPQGSMLALVESTGVALVNVDGSAFGLPAAIFGQATALAFHPDGKTMAIGLKDGAIVLWDFESRQEKLRITGFTSSSGVGAVAFSLSGDELAASYGNGIIAFWDSKSGQSRSQPVKVFDNLKDVAATLAYSSDGKTLVATANETMSLWDVSSHHRVNVFSRQTLFGVPLVAAFSPDSKLLVWSTQAQGDVNLLDARAREQFGPPLSYWSGQSLVSLMGLAFARDGKMLAATYAWGMGNAPRERRIVLWNFDIDEWKRQACAIANRNLTQGEWAQYMGSASYRKTCPELP